LSVIWQGRAQRSEADGMRDGGKHVMKKILDQLMQLTLGKDATDTTEGKAHTPDDAGSRAKSESDKAALHEWLETVGKERRLVLAWLTPRLDEAVKLLERKGQVMQSTWGLMWEAAGPSGLKWQFAGTSKPATGQELIEPRLEKALSRKTELTQDEWDAVGIRGLSKDHFIKPGDSYIPTIPNRGSWSCMLHQVLKRPARPEPNVARGAEFSVQWSCRASA